MRKGPGFFARMYGTGRISFLEAAKGYRRSLAGGACVAKGTLAVYDPWDFRRAAGDCLASVNADPRNHFGKHALRRFDNEH